MTFTPPRTVGLSVGIGAIATLLGADVLFFVLIVQTPLTVISVLWIVLILVSIPSLALLAYRTYGLAGARYVIDQNACTVIWGGLREVIPMNEITRLELGRDVEATLAPRGLWWPGCLVGHGHSEELGRLAFFAAAPQDYQVYLVTSEGAYALSPEDLEGFVGEFESARQQGITEPVEYETILSPLRRWRFWRERYAQALVTLPLLTALALFAWLALAYRSLPGQVPLHFDNAGLPDRLGPPAGLFILPAIAVVVWIVNTSFGVGLHIRGPNRLAAYSLWSATLFVHLLLWAAAITLVGRAA